MPNQAKAFQDAIWRRWVANKKEAQHISSGGDRLKKATRMVELLQERQEISTTILHKMQYAFGLEGWKENNNLRDLVRLQDKIRNALVWLVERPLREALAHLKAPNKYPVETAQVEFDTIVIPWWLGKAYDPTLLKSVEADMTAMFNLLGKIPLGEPGEEVFQAGGFTVVNKLLVHPGTALGKDSNALDYAQSASISKEIARTLIRVAGLLKTNGFGDLLYGEVEVLPMSQAKLRGKATIGLQAVYTPQSDRIRLYLLPIAYGGPQAVLALVHELGHRYYYKRMKQPQRLLWDDWSSRYKVPPVSERGATSPAEKFAEAFTWYVLAKHMGLDQREEFEAIMKKSRRHATEELATDPETGETHTLKEWAKVFADRVREAVRETRQVTAMVQKRAVGESLDRGWSGHSTFAPMRHAEGDEEDILAQPEGPASKYFFDSPIKRVFRDLQEKGHVPTPTEIVDQNPLGKEYSTLSRFVVRKAARPTLLDDRVVNEIVERVWRQLGKEFRRSREYPPEMPIGTHEFLLFLPDLSLTTVRGKQIKFDLMIGSKPSKNRDTIYYGYQGVYRENKMIIGFLLNGVYQRDVFLRAEFKKEFRRMLIHELTHVSDYSTTSYDLGDNTIGATPQSLPAYYNDPAEVRAYMQQIVDDVMERRGNPMFSKIKRTRPLLLSMIRNSPIWKQISPYLTPQNRNLILKAVYTVAQDRGFLKTTMS